MFFVQIIKKIKPLYLFSLFSWKIFISFKLTLKYLLKKNVLNRNEDIIILGNGPSLKKDLPKIIKKIKNYKILAVNSFCTDPAFEIIKPSLYMLADPSYYKDNVSGTGLKDSKIFIDTFIKKVTWNIILILPENARNSLLHKTLMKNKNIIFEFISTNDEFKPVFISKFNAYNKNVLIPKIQNVLIFALYYTIYNKYTNIFLFGSDHNWCKDIFVTSDNVVYIEEHHFYKNEHTKVHPMEDYDGSHWSMGRLFDAWALVYNQYYEIEKYAVYNGCNIWNESTVSFIDAFKRKSGRF